MVYRVVVEVDEENLEKIKALGEVKSMRSVLDVADITEKAVAWIEENERSIIDVTCSYVYERYCDAFPGLDRLSRNHFYALVRDTLKVSSKVCRIADHTANCFVKW